MTREEAIRTLCNTAFVGVKGNEYKVAEAVRLAVEAIEKQIPKTPNYEGDGYWDGELVYDTWICPNCGKDYEVDYEDYKYCPECGQAIDWSDSE